MFEDIVARSLSVREAENISRSIATDRTRAFFDPEIRKLQEKIENALGTRVRIDKKGNRGRIYIDFFSEEELGSILGKIAPQKQNPDFI